MADRQTTSQKHRSFVSEPMGGKSSKEIAGIGKTIGTKLEASGYGQAERVYGKYLVQQGDPAKFQKFMSTTGGANSKQSNDAHRCLSEWKSNFQ